MYEKYLLEQAAYLSATSREGASSSISLQLLRDVQELQFFFFFFNDSHTVFTVLQNNDFHP
jgi:hypothetical protein